MANMKIQDGALVDITAEVMIIVAIDVSHDA